MISNKHPLIPDRPKVNMACAHCGSVDVLCDAYAEWDVRTQQWELASTFDKGAFCTNCDGECRIVEKEIEG